MSKWLYNEYLIFKSDYCHVCYINRNRIYLAIIIFKKINHIYLFKGEVAVFLSKPFFNFSHEWAYPVQINHFRFGTVATRLSGVMEITKMI